MPAVRASLAASLAVLCGLLPALALAQTKVGEAVMFGLAGTCEALSVGTRALGADCTAKLLNVSYPDGRVGFYFVLADGRIVTFSGMDGDNPTPDSDVMTIEKVIMSRTDRPDRPDVLPASGTCSFGNPYKGPMTVSCTGTLSAGGNFSARFTSDGKPPT